MEIKLYVYSLILWKFIFFITTFFINKLFISLRYISNLVQFLHIYITFCYKLSFSLFLLFFSLLFSLLFSSLSYTHTQTKTQLEFLYFLNILNKMVILKQDVKEMFKLMSMKNMHIQEHVE